MMDRSLKPPEALIQAISQDLRPVRPSPQPLHLALRMGPLALLVSSLILVAMGVRRDSSTLGPLLTWGASSGQFVLAIALVWVAAHESTPAGRLPRPQARSMIHRESRAVPLQGLIEKVSRVTIKTTRYAPIAAE